VWMGRDDARAIAGLQGGTAPARAFHDFMAVAVARRPVEQFDTQVPVPDWQLTPEEEMFGDAEVDANTAQPMLVDENGMPIGTPPADPNYPQPQPMVRPDGSGEPSQQELDRAFPPQQQQQQPPPQPAPAPRNSNDPLAPAADAPEARPNSP